MSLGGQKQNPRVKSFTRGFFNFMAIIFDSSYQLSTIKTPERGGLMVARDFPTREWVSPMAEMPGKEYIQSRVPLSTTEYYIFFS